MSEGQNTPPSEEATAPGAIPKKRLWIYRIIAITVIPVLFFILLELGLHVVGFGYPTSAIVEQKAEETVYAHDNPKFGYQFFSRNLAREFSPFRIGANKPSETYRIVVLGGSAAQGVPDAAYSFGRILDVMLQIRYPSVDFEVVTLAMPAINSHVVLQIAKDCLRIEPDLFVAYMGNNEVVGPYGPGSTLATFYSNLWLLRLVITLKSTKTAQVVTAVLNKAGLLQKEFDRWQGMQMFLDKQIRHDDPRIKTLQRHFEKNLEALGKISKRNDVKLIYCTVGSNLRNSPPFSSSHRQGLTDAEKAQWRNQYEEGITLEESGKYDQAVQRYLVAAQIDSEYADLQYRLGQCYWENGNYTAARSRFELARQFDTNQFRVTRQLNGIIRDVSTREHRYTSLVDVERVFEQNSPHAIPGKELFLEHVHMNFGGNYLVARSVLSQLEQILPEDTAAGQSREGVDIDRNLCKEYLVYSKLAEYNILHEIRFDYLQKPPFTNQLYHKETLREFDQRLASFRGTFSKQMYKKVIQDYEAALERRPSDWWLHWNYAGILGSTEVGALRQAARHYRIVKNSLSHYANAYVMYGLVLGKLGQLNGAVAMSTKALELDPTQAEAYFNLGLVNHMRRNPKQAAANYEKALKYKPGHVRACNNLAVIYTQEGRVQEAMDILQQGLSANPQSIDLHFNYAILLNRTGRRQGAIELLRQALEIDPNSVKVRKKLHELVSE